MNVAIYIRQSVEKRDSLSLDTQQQACVAICEARDWDYEIYSDAGFSGKDIRRPALRNLTDDIKSGKINCVIAYRMDRISRSLLDFASLVRLFEDHKVQFMSATEQFDTSTPMGRAMVYIIMTFAQLERETIRERIRDSWFHRAKRGIFTGGKPPYGYINVRKIIDGKEQSVLEIDPETADNLKLVYQLYVMDNLSLNAVAKEMNNRGIPSPRGERWTSSGVKSILKNPSYTPALPAVYRYYDEKGFNIISDLEKFDGSHGVYVGGTRTGAGKDLTFNPYSERFVIVGLNKPLIEADTWLSAQYRLDNNVNSGRRGTGRRTWLGGLIKCADCGYTMEVVTNGVGKYYHRCGGRSQRGIDSCVNTKYHKTVDLEKVIGQHINNHIKEQRSLDIEEAPDQDEITRDAMLIDIDKKIKNLVIAIENGSPAAPLNRRITDLEAQRKEIFVSMAQQTHPVSKLAIRELLSQPGTLWDTLDKDEKYRIASIFVSSITIDKDKNIDIEYTI